MSDLTDILACPRCDTPLQNLPSAGPQGGGLQGSSLQCPGCQIEFPTHDDVPWLVAEPAAMLTDWRNRWHMALAQLAEQALLAHKALQGASGKAARERLQTLSDGYERQQAALKNLLSSLALDQGADLTTYLALKTRLPTHSGLLSYQSNVFRDWCWGEAENSASLQCITHALEDKQPQKILVLGAGAGRLAYDIHQSFAPAFTVALDINPYLTTVAQQMASGDSLTLVEFPLAPCTGGQSALARSLQAPQPANPGFHVVLADVMRAPFVPGAFDLVVTPWLVDVLDAAPDQLVPRFNHLLGDGGIWAFHGSLAFTQRDPAECLNLEELIEQSQQLGFQIRNVGETILPYMDCPDSRHGRRESVITLTLEKVRAVEQPARHQSLPDWIAKGRSPVPLLSAFQSQAAVTRIHAFIMSLIDGKRSLKDIALVMEGQQLMPRDDAETAIRGFLIKMFDEAGRQGL